MAWVLAAVEYVRIDVSVDRLATPLTWLLPLHVTGIVFSLIFVVKRLMLRERTGSLMPENQSDTI
jgi:hypothetical protein